MVVSHSRLVLAGVLFAYLAVASPSAAVASSVKANVTSCPVNCAGVTKRPVCASDGRSYPSSCEVRRQNRCEGRTLTVVWEKECPTARPRDKSDALASSPCLAERERLLRQMQEAAAAARRKPAASASSAAAGSSPPSKTQVVPECKADGSYQEVQCHAGTRYCWCVNTDDGKPIAKSSVLNARPVCGRSRSEDRPAEECTDQQRKEFNANLVRLFVEEYARLSEETKRHLESSHESSTGDVAPDAQDQIVLDWKFDELDKNKDRELQQAEIRNLKKIVRNNVRPKECAKDFTDRCDKDLNTEISRSEWSLCLGKGLEPFFHLFSLLNSDPPVAQENGWGGDDGLPIRDSSQTMNENDNNRSPPELSSRQSRFQTLLEFKLAASGRDRDASTNEDSHYEDSDQYTSPNMEITRRADDQDRRRMRANAENLISVQKRTCLDDRETALRTQDRDSSKFVPTCQDGGKFQREQCHTVTGHCWCVHEDTGQPIQGTVVQKPQPPNCSALTGSVSDTGDEEDDESLPASTGDGCSSARSRELAECPNKQAFLTELVDVITKEMAEVGSSSNAAGARLPSSIAEDPTISIEEKAIRWKVLRVDKNANDIIDKKEMKEFKKVLNSKKIRSPKKCSRNFVSYCDIDQDQRLSVAELLECTEIKAQPNSAGRLLMTYGDSSNAAARCRTQQDIPPEKQNPFLYLLKPSLST